MNTVGVDIGGTNIRAVLLNEHQQIVKENIRSTHPERGPDEIIEEINEITAFVKENEKVGAIGIGSPGPLDPWKGVIKSPPNLPGWENVPLKEMMEQYWGVPVFVENDANCAALAEAVKGIGADAESIFYLTVSTGVGGSYIVNKEIIHGKDGFSGEVGYMMMNSGKSFKDAVSGKALEKQCQSAGIPGNVRQLFYLAEVEKEEISAGIVDQFTTNLSILLANVIFLLNPEKLILGGGVMASSSYFLGQLKEKTNHLVYPKFKKEAEIYDALSGQKAGAIGAALLPHYR
ncbi:ROK family protein [Thalassorhabdus alkalitolerans]|uniref:ROK family protein n=1 Tax=Thalassorhabdus alkalitolerans TaxID=2282697 RepID=A0ABW0YQE1_9BACI